MRILSILMLLTCILMLLTCSTKVFAGLSCSNLLNSGSFFYIQKYQNVIQPVQSVDALTRYEQKLMDEFLYMGEMIAELDRYGWNNRLFMNGLDSDTAGILRDDFVHMITDKFPRFSGTVFRSIKIEKPSEFPTIGWPNEETWSTYRSRILALEKGTFCINQVY